jgi:hypothetical protein
MNEENKVEIYRQISRKSTSDVKMHEKAQKSNVTISIEPKMHVIIFGTHMSARGRRLWAKRQLGSVFIDSTDKNLHGVDRWHGEKKCDLWMPWRISTLPRHLYL